MSCLQELLEFWLRIQRGMEADVMRFQDSIRKVAALTQDLKHIGILLDVLITEVCFFSCDKSLEGNSCSWWKTA